MIRHPLLALAIAQSCCAWAQGDDAALRREVQELKSRVSAIEKQLNSVPSDHPADVPARAPALMAPSASSNAWMRVRRGMARDEIQNLLGSPQKVFELDGSLVWYYRNEAGAAGSVFFDTSGHASDFQRPSDPRLW